MKTEEELIKLCNKRQAMLEKAEFIRACEFPGSRAKDDRRVEKARSKLERTKDLLKLVVVNNKIKQRMNRGKLPTQSQLIARLRYCNDTGKLYCRKTGREIGTPSSTGHLRYNLNYRSMYVHRIIWCIVYGYWSEVSIDHIDRDPYNNKLKNLREVSHQCNIRNSKPRTSSKTGVKGVRPVNSGRYIATIGVKGQPIQLYRGLDFIEACCHRLAAEQALTWNLCEADSPAMQEVNKYLAKACSAGNWE